MKRTTRLTLTLALLVGQALTVAAQTPSYWTADGVRHILDTDGLQPVVVPAVAVAVDLRGAAASVPAIDTGQANPNCLYYADSENAVAGLPGQNVVCNGVAEEVILTDEADFRCPEAFTATDILFRMTPGRDIPDGPALNYPYDDMVVLPFDMDEVTIYAANQPYTPAANWFMAAQLESCDNELVFTPLPDGQVQANMPCYVRISVGAYGSYILFTGHNKRVADSGPVDVQANVVCLMATTVERPQTSDAYYYRRSPLCYFQRGSATGVVRPFRCFLKLGGYTNNGEDVTDNCPQADEQGRIYFRVNEEESTTTGIFRREPAASVRSGWPWRASCTLAGQSWPGGMRGICVRAGKKVVVK